MKKLLILIVILSFSTTTFAQYIGETFVIDCNNGGFNNNQNTDLISADDMVDGTRNINLHKSGRSKRGGTSHVNPTVITNTPRIYGLYQFRERNGTETIITATGDGKIQKNYNTEIGTGLTINQAVHFETFNNLLIICTGNNLPQIWTGTGNISAMSNVPTDWSGSSNFPRKMVKHGRLASERLWAIGGAVDPFTVYASDLNAKDGTTEPDFSDANVITIFIETSDGFGIVNAVEFTDRLICAGRSTMYLIDDLDIDTANWGYEKSAWEGGCATSRLMIAVTNDVISMDENGTIFSVTGTQTYGDYKKASLTRPNFIDQWIRDNVKLSAIDDFHMVYDPVLRAIYIFVVRSGKTEVDTALVYFIDRGPDKGWMIKDNLSSDSGYKASSSALVRKAVGDNKIYTGGWGDGFVWELETTSLNDNGEAYAAGFKTPAFHMGDPRLTKNFNTGWIIASEQGTSNLLVDVWIDGVLRAQQTVSLSGAGTGGIYGSGVYGTSIYGGDALIEVSFPIDQDGKRLEIQIHNNAAGNEDFFITLLMIDFEARGRLVD